MAVIRFSQDAKSCLIEEDDGTLRVASQHDMDTLKVGPDFTAEEYALILREEGNEAPL
jgi:hypothetical protein